MLLLTCVGFVSVKKICEDVAWLGGNVGGGDIKHCMFVNDCSCRQTKQMATVLIGALIYSRVL